MSLKRKQHRQKLKLMRWHEFRDKAPAIFQELRSNFLRSWFIKGQAYYDACVSLLSRDRHDDTLEVIEQELSELNDTQREGFLMGYNAAKAVDELDLDQAIRGGVRYEPEVDFAESRFLYGAKGTTD